MKKINNKVNLYDIASKNNTCMNVIIELLTACNWKCKHCYIPKHDSYGLSFEQLVQIFKQLRELNTFDITLTGGEVFLRNDIFDIIESARNMGFNIQILSNISLLTDESIEKLADLCVETVSCTIFSMNELIHDSITGVPGSLKKVINNIEKLLAKGIDVDVKNILFKDTYLEYKDVNSYCVNKGITHVATSNLFPRTDGSTDVLEMALEQKQLNEIIKDIDTIRGMSKKNISQDTQACCDLINHSLYIDCNGYIYPCNNLLVSIGDVKNDLIKDVWMESDFLKKIRNLKYKDLDKCSSCNDRNYCYRCPGVVLGETGNVKSYSKLECMHSLARKLND